MKLVGVKENLVWALSFAVVSVAVVGLDGLGVFGPIKRAVEPGVAEVSMLVGAVTKMVGAPAAAVKFYFKGGRVVSDLQARLAERLVDEARVAELAGENARMRKLLGVDLPAVWKFLPARVAAADEEKLLIVAGQADGVEQGMSVVSEAGVLVGRVGRVSAGVSEVVPVAAVKSSVAVRVAGGGAGGIVHMEGQGLVMGKILQETRIEMGDVVETSGEDGLVPGVLVARVVEVLEQEGQVYKQAKLVALAPTDQAGVFVVVGRE